MAFSHKRAGYVVFIITSFLAGVESGDQCLLNSKVLSCFSGVIVSIRSFFLFWLPNFGFKRSLLSLLKSHVIQIFLVIIK